MTRAIARMETTATLINIHWDFRIATEVKPDLIIHSGVYGNILKSEILPEIKTSLSTMMILVNSKSRISTHKFLD